MKKIKIKIKYLAITILLVGQISFGQNFTNEYSKFISKADSLYTLKEYGKSTAEYTKAFKSNNWKGSVNDRYNASCTWALAKVADSAFYHLNRIATKGNYMDYEHIIKDSDLISLHNDKRWKLVLELIKGNKDKYEKNLNKPLVAKLDSIHDDDQKYRLELSEIQKKYGFESAEQKAQWKIINSKDSINLIKITDILDKFGWLGSEIVGQKGNSTLFLVIQHSDQKTQERYLPMMREAVKKGNAQGNNLALLEDRVALGQGKKQIYGSQISRNLETNLFYVMPLENPESVNERRAQVGLILIEDYVSYWKIKWSVEEHKKDLLLIEEKNKKPKN